MQRSLVKFVSFSKSCDQNGDRVSKSDESYHIIIRVIKVFLVNYDKYGSLSIYDAF